MILLMINGVTYSPKDIYSQRILGLVPSLSMEASFAYQCLEQAFSQRKDVEPKGCIHHSDNGSQYDSKVYKKMLTDAEIHISRADNCLENGSAENLNSIVKICTLNLGVSALSKSSSKPARN
ncbi:MAG: DDE-type integrase/transposase/recombinase [Saprospiraceae bacterium]|nr:DDE-type integrase/transposase/recombinase [Saprospiraceae bacterium]